jgi:hypothetical protein
MCDALAMSVRELRMGFCEGIVAEPAGLGA